MSCLSCRSLSGEKRISPGELIYDGNYWIVDHAFPTTHVGWLVVVLKRHVEALHELTRDEFVELALIEEKLIRFFHQELGSSKEYVACFAEAEAFKHIHVHVIAKTPGFPEDAAGSKVFRLIKVAPEDVLPTEDIIKLTSRMKQALVD